MEAGRGARGWKTVLDQGMMDLVSLTDDHSDRVSWVRIQRWYYRHFLDEEPLKPLSRVYFLSDVAQKEIKSTLIRCQDLLHLFREQTTLLIRMPSEAMNKKFMLTWQRIQTNFEQSRWVGIIGLLWAYQTQNVKTDSLNELVFLLDRYDQLLESLCGYVDMNKTA